MTPDQFQALIAEVTDFIAARPLDADLQDQLNAAFPADGEIFAKLVGACEAAIAAGWMCDREHGGIRFGRVIKPAPATRGFSVDVVEMPAMAGPYHGHPKGEIDLIMPLDEAALFDGAGAGWMVKTPGSEHAPTVDGGRARVLYLLPDGEIDFSVGAKNS